MLALGLGLGVQSGIGNNTPIIQGARFDGTNDYLLRNSDLTGNADGSIGVFVARVKFNGGDDVLQYFLQNTTNVVGIQKLANNAIRAFLRTSAGVVLIQMDSTATITADGLYHNIAINWDTSIDANNSINIDGVVGQTLTTRVAGTIDYTRADWSIGAQLSGISPINADINFLYFNPAEFLDFNVVANYSKFFDSFNNPIYLGPDGSTPTGTSPIVYMAGHYSEWHINKGTGGGFTVTGALERPLP